MAVVLRVLFFNADDLCERLSSGNGLAGLFAIGNHICAGWQASNQLGRLQALGWRRDAAVFTKQGSADGARHRIDSFASKGLMPGLSSADKWEHAFQIKRE